jgi:outer membrane usher protein FimD/PapC
MVLHTKINAEMMINVSFINESRLTFKKIAVVVYSILTFVVCKVHAASEVEFNTDVLDLKDGKNIDLSKFSNPGYIMPGAYAMTIFVNNRNIGEHSVQWVTNKVDEKTSKPCLNYDVIERIGFKKKQEQKVIKVKEEDCFELSEINGLTAQPSLENSSLRITIPDEFLTGNYSNWEPPASWDKGIYGLIFDYYVNGQSRHLNGEGNEHRVNGDGTAGFNFDAWRVRADWQGDYENKNEGSRQSSLEWRRLYAYRALADIGAKITVGESSLYSDIFDSFSYTGASLISDDNMLPPNLRGYAPEITGVAKTNAKVIISQQGRIIQETQVLAGPFRIQDMNEAVSGELEVKVEEQDGTTQSFKVNSATIPYLTRPGQIRYKLSSGKPSDNDRHYNGPYFVMGEFSWGINNGWSLYGGNITSSDYNSLGFGIGRDLLILGAVSVDITQSWANDSRHNETIKGKSYRLSYSKEFNETNSAITFSGYRFADRDYMSMGEYLDAQDSGMRHENGKEMYTITYNRNFISSRLSMYLNFNHQTYWNYSPEERFTLTLSHYFDFPGWKNISVSGTAYKSQNSYNNDNGMYLSISLPWGQSETLSYSTSISEDDSSQQVGYSGSTSYKDAYQIRAGENRGKKSVDVNYDYKADISQINANASYRENDYTSLNLSVQGGLTITGNGSAFHRILTPGGTRIMFDTEGVAGIPINSNGNYTETNIFGTAVTTDIGNYYKNQIHIDLNATPDNVDAINSVVEATMTEGAIGYRKFNVIVGVKSMAILRLHDGSYPPFGAVVKNAKDQQVGIVDDEGYVYLSGIQAKEKMTVFWGDKDRCSIEIPNVFEKTYSSELFLPCAI